jgi:hypothetical protein
MAEHPENEGLTDKELAAQSGEALPNREVMSVLPQPDGGFVFIEPTDPTTDPPPPEDDPTEDGGQVSW